MTALPHRKVFALPSLADELDEATKNAIAARNICDIDGRCPECGAIGTLRSSKVDGVYGYVFAHEPDCIMLRVA